MKAEEGIGNGEFEGKVKGLEMSRLHRVAARGVVGASVVLVAMTTVGCGPAAEEKVAADGGGGEPSGVPQGGTESAGTGDNASGVAEMELRSGAFADGEAIPAKYTEDGEDVSPPLDWSDVPEATEELALICDDPDAPSPKNPRPDPWVHWVIYHIPADARSLPEGVPRTAELSEPEGAVQGVNSWGEGENVGYRGPAPPPGSGRHRYFFKLYALDSALNLGPKQDKQSLLAAMEGHVIGEGRLMGTYER